MPYSFWSLLILKRFHAEGITWNKSVSCVAARVHQFICRISSPRNANWRRAKFNSPKTTPQLANPEIFILLNKDHPRPPSPPETLKLAYVSNLSGTLYSVAFLSSFSIYWVHNNNNAAARLHPSTRMVISYFWCICYLWKRRGHSRIELQIPISTSCEGF